MDTKEELRVFRSFKGEGKVYKGAQFIADVNYSIKEVEEMHDTEPSGGAPSEELAGQRNICGTVRSPLAELLADYLGARLTLHFQDGRVLDFTVTKKLDGNWGNACLIQGLGGFLGMS